MKKIKNENTRSPTEQVENASWKTSNNNKTLTLCFCQYGVLSPQREKVVDEHAAVWKLLQTPIARCPHGHGQPMVGPSQRVHRTPQEASVVYMYMFMVWRLHQLEKRVILWICWRYMPCYLLYSSWTKRDISLTGDNAQPPPPTGPSALPEQITHHT